MVLSSCPILQVELLQGMNSDLQHELSMIMVERDRLQASEEASHALRCRVAELESQVGQFASASKKVWGLRRSSRLVRCKPGMGGVTI